MRLRQGDSDRDIARSGLMGRKKVAAVRELAGERGWLDGACALPLSLFSLCRSRPHNAPCTMLVVAGSFSKSHDAFRFVKRGESLVREEQER